MTDVEQAGRQLVAAIQHGDLASVEHLISQHPSLVSARVHGGRTALHVVADWPGYFPTNGPQVVRLLLDLGADPNARTDGDGSPEAPLHWAASTDDVEVADVLIDGGADLEAEGGSIGTPLANAVGYGCWHVARRLVERGAVVRTLWQAAALGFHERVVELMTTDPAPEAVTEAFWQACHGGQRRVAAYLLAHGADPMGRPGYADKAAAEVAAGPDTRRELLVAWLRDQDPNAES